ncbi:MAG: sulfatase-like hydrolase/transferase [Pirellulales bacterium]
MLRIPAFVLLCTLAIIGSVRTYAAERPNVLLICVDDLKPALGCYGDKIAQSPNIDRLAKRGVLFERAYCNQAVCSPSRNALLTGLRSQTLGIYDLATNFRLSQPDALTLPQYFKQQGYRTEGMGKIFHVGHGNHEDDASWSVPHFRPKATQYASLAAKVNSAKNDTASGSEDAKGAATEAADVADNFYADGALADEAVKRISAAGERDQPFFIAVGFVKPHLPFVAPQKYWDMYDPKSLPLAEFQAPPADAPVYAPQFGGELRNYADIPKQGLLPEALQRQLVHGYYAATSYMDAQVGRVLDALERTGKADNTIVVLWGDHGWHLGDHGMWCKHTNYEQATHIPVIIAAPKHLQDRRCSALIESVDIFPTLCELADLPVPKGPQGASFAKTLDSKDARTKEYVIHVYPRSAPGKGNVLGRAVRTERYRLVEWKAIGADADSAEIELYDYVADPLEKKNAAADHPEVVKELRAILAAQPEAVPQIKSKTDAVGSASTPSAAKPKQDRDKMFTTRDKNSDGKLTRDEFLTGQPDPDEAPKRFTRFDRNGDGQLSREEFVKAGKD